MIHKQFFFTEVVLESTLKVQQFLQGILNYRYLYVSIFLN